jgi:GntR family transcriptional regulator
MSALLLAIVDEAIERARELGVSPRGFAHVAYFRAKQCRDVEEESRIVFVECAARIAVAFAQVIRDRLDVEVTPVALQDLEQPTPEVEMCVRNAHVVATTFFHLEEVRQLLREVNRRVVGLGLRPHLQKLVQIGEIPEGTCTAMVCVSDCSAQNMRRSLEDAGVQGLDVTVCGAGDSRKLAETLAGRAVVIASDVVADEVQPLLELSQKLIVLDYLALDEGGISLLRSLLEGAQYEA